MATTEQRELLRPAAGISALLRHTHKAVICALSTVPAAHRDYQQPDGTWRIEPSYPLMAPLVNPATS